MMLEHLARRVTARMPAGSFLRHAFAITSGVAFAQVLALLAAPIISRLYSPSVYGTVATLASLAAICLVVASLRFEVAIPIATDDEQALALTAVAFVSSIVFTILATIALLVLPRELLAAIGFAGAVWDYRWVVPIFVIAAACQTIVTQYGTFRRSYRALATSQAVQASASNGVKIGIGIVAPEIGGLILGELAKRCFGIGVIVRQAGLHLRDVLRQCSASRLRATASAYHRYPAFVLPSALLNVIGLQAPVVLLSAHFSTVQSGLYALGLIVVQVPLTFVQTGISNAFVSRIREYERQGRLVEVIRKMVQALAVVSAPWFAMCAAWGPDAMALAFGARWREAGTYLALLVPWLFIGFVFSGCGMVLWARNRQGADFGWQVVLISTRLTALEVGARVGSAVVAVGGFAAVSFLALCGYEWWLLRFARVPVAESLLYAVRELAMYLALAGAARLALAQIGIDNAAVGIAITVLVVGVVALLRLRTHAVFSFLWRG